MRWHKKAVFVLTGLCVFTSAEALSRPLHAGYERHARVPAEACYTYDCSRAQIGGPYPSHARGGSGVSLGPRFVPGRGIVNEDCDLPTSACPNTQRD
jgi:hypothetical protein